MAFSTLLDSTLLEQVGSKDAWADFLPHQPRSSTSATIDKDIPTCWLNQFSALKIFGPDAERFLQGQLTCNLNQVTTETVHYGACCNAKGRVVANFNISFDGENYWLILPSESADLLEKHLQKYKVFFKASIENCQQQQLIFGQWLEGTEGSASHSDAHYLSISDHRRMVIIDAQSEFEFAQLVPTLEWRLADINDGIHYISSDQTQEWLPQHLNWHRLGGISFNKGCYTGQEIIARLQYLGKAKKALYHYRGTGLDQTMSLTDNTAQPLYNTAGKNLGEILFSRNQGIDGAIQLDVLAVLNTDAPDKILYLTNSMEFPLTLQNISYTEENTA